MRIGMMADLYKPHVSGVTMYISLNKRFLEQTGHEVFVFTFGDVDYVDVESNVIRSPGIPFAETGLYLNFRYKRRAQNLLKSMDIVHVNHPITSGRLALRYAQPLGIPIVFTNHTRYDLYAQIYTPMLPDVIGESVVRAYMPFFCKSIDLVIAPSPGLRDVLKGYGVQSNVVVIPNGVDISPFQAPVEPVSRAELGFGDEVTLLTYMGRLGPEKNLPFLLRAFGGIASAFEQVGLLIVGDGPVREDLEDRVKLMGLTDRVRFTGLIPYEQLPRYLATADAFVTASVTEVHPLSVIEAMAAGLPVVGIRSPGVGDTVEDGVNGLLAPEEDLSAYTAVLARMIAESNNRQRMGHQARIKAQSYAIEHTGQILLDHYEQLVKAARPIRQKRPSRVARRDQGKG
jgi:glycosyltransferase involved in cell wall biosynthesis